MRKKNAVDPSTTLSRRERQIMDILYARGKASAAEVHEAMSDAPSYSAVRALLRILEDKGHVSHAADGARYIFQPTQARKTAAKSALRQVLNTFFDGSVENVVAALISSEESNLSEEDLSRLARLIQSAKESGKP